MLSQSILVFGKPDGDRPRSPRADKLYDCQVLPSPRSHAGAASYKELEARGQAVERNTSSAKDLGLWGEMNQRNTRPSNEDYEVNFAMVPGEVVSLQILDLSPRRRVVTLRGCCDPLCVRPSFGRSDLKPWCPPLSHVDAPRGRSKGLGAALWALVLSLASPRYRLRRYCVGTMVQDFACKTPLREVPVIGFKSTLGLMDKASAPGACSHELESVHCFCEPRK